MKSTDQFELVFLETSTNIHNIVDWDRLPAISPTPIIIPDKPTKRLASGNCLVKPIVGL